MSSRKFGLNLVVVLAIAALFTGFWARLLAANGTGLGFPAARFYARIPSNPSLVRYDVVSGKIVLAGGPPQVMQGRNILEGEVITFWRDEQRLECKPKARLVVYSEDFGDAEIEAMQNLQRTRALLNLA